MKTISNILWIDCLGALAVGSLVLALNSNLAKLHHLPAQILIFLGIVNLAYGCFSLSLALRNRRSMTLVSVLSVANILWAPICWIIYIVYAAQISLFGTIHIIGESFFVGLLGIIEWKNRHLLTVNCNNVSIYEIPEHLIADK